MPPLQILREVQICIFVERLAVQVTPEKGDLPHEALDLGVKPKRLAIVKGRFGHISRHLDQPQVFRGVNLCLLFQMDQF